MVAGVQKRRAGLASGPVLWRVKFRLLRVLAKSPPRSSDCNNNLGYELSSPAASTEALRFAIASMEIMGFTPEALGKVEPSMT